MKCACCMEPATDETPDIDLCSEATGANDGRAWKIKRCSLHAAAPELLAALRALLAHPKDDGAIMYAGNVLEKLGEME